MDTINLKKILEGLTPLERSSMARQLFPRVYFWDRALTRAAEEGARLDGAQIVKLSEITGIGITDLINGVSVWGEGKRMPKDGAVWKSSHKNGTRIFKTGVFRAELDAHNWVTKIFDENILFYEGPLSSGDATVSEYLEELNSQISKRND